MRLLTVPEVANIFRVSPAALRHIGVMDPEFPRPFGVLRPGMKYFFARYDYSEIMDYLEKAKQNRPLTLKPKYHCRYKFPKVLAEHDINYNDIKQVLQENKPKAQTYAGRDIRRVDVPPSWTSPNFR